jgi:hypothetical protein
MEFITQAQTLLSQNIYMVGVGLLLAVLLAGVAWYSMSRPGSNSSSGKSVLENQARMDDATTDVPENAAQSQPLVPPQQSQEDIEKQLAAMGAVSPTSSN